jgi:hypothetical protein
VTLQPRVFSCAQSGAEPDPQEIPLDDDEWDEFDPTPLEAWILDDFEWDVEESYPDQGDFWDDSRATCEDDLTELC